MSEPSAYYLLIPGIRSDPEDQTCWAIRGVEWIERKTRQMAGSYLYHVLASTRFTEQARHASNIAARIKSRAEWCTKIVVAGHSNGCALITRAIRDFEASMRRIVGLT